MAEEIERRAQLQPMPNFISEDQIERALVQKLQHLHGFDSLDCHTEDPEDLNDGSGRTNKRESSCWIASRKPQSA